ncbi:MAG: WecB/TagA/CpsF family glycosyltransferase [Ilumatobacteraceae bacterium]|nr:WecB/TagA/CpsF family glycosyltransferase [Ilumatobacter sp.]MCB0983629.1 WecB/TagA/CpsF family glycosyltransferase [Ilumatobacter sp.]
MSTLATKRVELFGVDVDALTMDETVQRIMELVEAGTPVQHVVLNASKVVMMANDERLRAVIAACPVVNADGQSVVTASRILRRPLPERVAGIDLFVELVKRSAADGRSVYFLGARDEVLDEMVRRFREQYPALNIAGWRNGYWEDDDAVVAQVREAHPDLVFLAIPSPRKEFWLAEHMPAMGVPFAMGVGGSFDVVAGKVKRAPVWVQRIGCEWVYRLVQEPRRMWKRYLVGNTKFIILTAKEWRRNRR